MEALTERAIRGCFVNCSKGEAQRLTVPRRLAELPWDDLDFLGWRDPKAPGRGYLVTRHRDRLVGMALLLTAAGPRQRRAMCSLCLTTHSGGGVCLATAHKARGAGRDDDSVGEYVCTDLACSLYVRGVKRPEQGERIEESLTVQEQVARLRDRLSGFVDKLFV
jgi:hypothetical protein